MFLKEKLSKCNHLLYKYLQIAPKSVQKLYAKSIQNSTYE